MNNEVESNQSIKYKVILLIIFVMVVFIFYLVLRDRNTSKEIDSNLGVAKGIITKINYVKSPYFQYNYMVDGELYEGQALDTRDFNFIKFCPNFECLNDSVMIEYSTLDPSKSRVVFFGMKSYR